MGVGGERKNKGPCFMVCAAAMLVRVGSALLSLGRVWSAQPTGYDGLSRLACKASADC